MMAIGSVVLGINPWVSPLGFTMTFCDRKTQKPKVQYFLVEVIFYAL